MQLRTPSASLLDVEAGDAGAALGYRRERGEHANERGFAGAVGAEQAKDLAFGDAEADVINGNEGAEALGHVLDFDGTGTHARSLAMELREAGCSRKTDPGKSRFLVAALLGTTHFLGI